MVEMERHSVPTVATATMVVFFHSKWEELSSKLFIIDVTDIIMLKWERFLE